MKLDPFRDPRQRALFTSAVDNSEQQLGALVVDAEPSPDPDLFVRVALPSGETWVHRYHLARARVIARALPDHVVPHCDNCALHGVCTSHWPIEVVDLPARVRKELRRVTRRWVAIVQRKQGAAGRVPE